MDHPSNPLIVRLQTDGWQCTESVADRVSVTVQAPLVVLPPCPRCGSYDVDRWGTTPIEVVDAPWNGTPVRLLVHQQRLRCRPTRHTWTVPPAQLDAEHHVTMRLRGWVQSAAQAHDNAAIARHTGLSEATVRRLLVPPAPALPIRIGLMDLQHQRRVHPVIVHLDTATVHTVVWARTVPALQRALPWAAHPPGIVVADADAVYVEAARTLAPTAELMVRPALLLARAKAAVDRYRLTVQRTLAPRAARRLSQARGIFTMRDELRDGAARHERHVWQHRTPQLVALADAYLTLASIWELPTSDEAAQYWSRWRLSLPPLQKHMFGSVVVDLDAWAPWLIAGCGSPLRRQMDAIQTALMDALAAWPSTARWPQLRAHLISTTLENRDAHLGH